LFLIVEKNSKNESGKMFISVERPVKKVENSEEISLELEPEI
jgi:hypothetical protein